MKYLELVLTVSLTILVAWGFNALTHFHAPASDYVNYAIGLFLGALCFGRIVHGQKPRR